ncbi:hypothetical protein FC99_GL000782 [Levilactobacillus koreensis JCM 16448]|nr:hypothetical protein [Levilactobacillus koreensis]KRK87797.1 hypothetical protein FC99_GL000782 [Levilactobacillus koreensis JCM 16448]
MTKMMKWLIALLLGLVLLGSGSVLAVAAQPAQTETTRGNQRGVTTSIQQSVPQSSRHQATELIWLGATLIGAIGLSWALNRHHK